MSRHERAVHSTVRHGAMERGGSLGAVARVLYKAERHYVRP